MDRISDDTLNELFTQNNQKDVNRIDDIINSISIPSYPEIWFIIFEQKDIG